MGRCKHRHPQIIEFGIAHTEHFYIGEQIVHNSVIGDYTGRVCVSCGDCGYKREFSNISKAPKWAQRFLEEATASDEV